MSIVIEKVFSRQPDQSARTTNARAILISSQPDLLLRQPLSRRYLLHSNFCINSRYRSPIVELGIIYEY